MLRGQNLRFTKAHLTAKSHERQQNNKKRGARFAETNKKDQLKCPRLPKIILLYSR